MIDIKFPKFPWRFHLGGVYEVGGTIRADAGTGAAVATFQDQSGNVKEVRLAAGKSKPTLSCLDRLAPSQKQLVSMMLQDHAADIDMCLVGEKGVGKTMILGTFAEILGYRRITVFCFKDLMARDLLQRRCTDAMGQTEWKDSAVVEAAVAGHLVVLDGLQRLAPGNLYAALGGQCIYQ